MSKKSQKQCRLEVQWQVFLFNFYRGYDPHITVISREDYYKFSHENPERYLSRLLKVFIPLIQWCIDRIWISDGWKCAHHLYYVYSQGLSFTFKMNLLTHFGIHLVPIRIFHWVLRNFNCNYSCNRILFWDGPIWGGLYQGGCDTTTVCAFMRNSFRGMR